jgi:hypothetical protein
MLALPKKDTAMKTLSNCSNLCAGVALLAVMGCAEEASLAPASDVSSAIVSSSAQAAASPINEAGHPYFTVGITSIVSRTSPDQTEQTEITFKVTNRSGTAVSFIAFGTGGLTRLAPGEGSIHTGTLGTYRVGYTNLVGNPGFESIKFDALPGNEGFKNGASEYFTITVKGYRSDYVLNVQAHAGRIWETFSGITTQ